MARPARLSVLTVILAFLHRVKAMLRRLAPNDSALSAKGQSMATAWGDRPRSTKIRPPSLCSSETQCALRAPIPSRSERSHRDQR